jgi:hypothetical protein
MTPQVKPTWQTAYSLLFPLPGLTVLLSYFIFSPMSSYLAWWQGKFLNTNLHFIGHCHGGKKQNDVNNYL